MFRFIKHRVVNLLEKIPFIQIFIYNNLVYFKFLFPHDKDYYALKLLFSKSEKRSFLDVGGNIGLSTIGFRELGFNENKIFIFEPDTYLYKKFLVPLKKIYKNIIIYNFGLSDKSEKKNLFQAYYKNLFLHFNNSFDLKFIKKKIKENYPNKHKKFSYLKKKLKLEKFDKLKFKKEICFVKIDVEGFDHFVLKGMTKLIKKYKPVFLIEFNISNFKIIHKLLKKDYSCYIYLFEKNRFKKISKSDNKKLFSNKTIDSKYTKNSFNVFFIRKKFQFLDNRY